MERDSDARPAVELLGRLGLLSRGALWSTIGVLAVRLALTGRSQAGESPDKGGAIRVLATRGGGRPVLAALVVGFAAMTLWSIVEAVQARQGSRGGHWGHRLAAAGRVVVYGTLAVSTAAATWSGRETEAGGRGGGDEIGDALGWPGGRLLVGALALGLAGAAATNVVRAVTRRYERHWERSRMRGWRPTVAGPAEVAGHLGHALAFALVGWFLFVAALRFDPRQPKTLDQSLAALVAEPHGRAACLVVAVGVVAWGLCSFAQAMWRKVPED